MKTVKKYTAIQMETETVNDNVNRTMDKWYLVKINESLFFCKNFINIVANVPQLCLVAEYEAIQYQITNNFNTSKNE